VRKLLAVLLVLACGRETPSARRASPGDVALPGGQDSVIRITDSTGLPPEGVLSRVAIGDIAGAGNNTAETNIKSPDWGNVAAIHDGRDLFVNMNCAACHGYDLKGGMGPDLTDTYWRYGGSPADIYKSIFEGRPQGMPAWGRSIQPAMIWKVVAYIESKGGAFPAALADKARQGDEGDKDTTSMSTMKGRNNVH
jgi:cytochrome c oxidase cbb3-type subunit 3